MGPSRPRRPTALGRFGTWLRDPQRATRPGRTGAVVALGVVIALAGTIAAATGPAAAPAGHQDRLIAASPTPPVTMVGSAEATPADSTGPDPGGATAAPTLPTSLPPDELSDYRWPLANARVTTWFAPTDDGFIVLGGQRVHDGIDLATYCGDTVRAAHAGVVVYAGRFFDWYMGYDGSPQPYYDELTARKLPSTVLPIVVVVDDGNGYRGVYVHLASTVVTAGQAVRAGQALGREGRTGHATGCHLHYGLIRLDGGLVPIEPTLVDKWHYPSLIRERIDPLLVLSLLDPGAPRQIPGLPPPTVSPSGTSFDALMALWRARAANVMASPATP